MELAQALRLKVKSALPSTPIILAAVGAGGKTTALFQLARELLGNPSSTVLVTTTTHLAKPQAMLADWHLISKDQDTFQTLSAPLPRGVGLVTGPITADERWSCISPEWLDALHLIAKKEHYPILIEADGSRLRPLKAPASHEPAIPPFVDLVLYLVGLSALGKPLNEQWVHRPEIFTYLASLEPGGAITSQAISRVLCHPSGGLKNIPAQARRVLLLNQVNNLVTSQAAHDISTACLGQYDAVLAADLAQASRVQTIREPIAGVILAAGKAQRFGQPKQLLPWHGKTLVNHVASIALQAGCSPVFVVVGAYAVQVRQALRELPVEVIENISWKDGLSTSVRVAVEALPGKTGAAIFMLVDQPQVTASLVEQLISSHQHNLAPLTAPRVLGQRANPIMFDRAVFHQLLRLQGDVGGRALFEQPELLPVNWLEWDDPNLLLDIDTPQDYARLQGGTS